MSKTGYQDAEYLSLQQAAKEHPGGRIHVNTMRRWSIRGYAGIILKTKRITGKRLTTRAWLSEFYNATSTVEDPNPNKRSPSVSVKSPAHEKAVRQLAAEGI